MINQDPQYRGRLIYSQEYGYKLITMKVRLSAGEHSEVIIHCHYLDIREEAKHHKPSSLQDPYAVDEYSFPVVDGQQITLTITSQEEKAHEARYTILANRIDEDSRFFWLDIVQSRDGTDELSLQAENGLDIDFGR